MGVVYLIQPVELVGTMRYKVGMSSLDNLTRMKAYKNGTRHLIICECDNTFFVERKLIKAFNKEYKLIGGKEYFEVDCELKMINLFISIVMNHKNKSAKEPMIDMNHNNKETEEPIVDMNHKTKVTEEQTLEEKFNRLRTSDKVEHNWMQRFKYKANA